MHVVKLAQFRESTINIFRQDPGQALVFNQRHWKDRVAIRLSTRISGGAITVWSR